MKKSELRHIIRELIKEQKLSENTGPQGGNYHVYTGCNFNPSTGYGGVGNGWNNQIVNQINNPNPSDVYYYFDSLIGPTSYDGLAALTDEEQASVVLNNNNVIHNVWANPSVGTVIKMYTCPPESETCNPTCMTYQGTTDWPGSGYTSFAASAGVSNPAVVHYDSCQSCLNNVDPYSPGGGDDVYGCTDPEASNYNQFATIDDGSCIDSDDIDPVGDPCESLYTPFSSCYFYLVLNGPGTESYPDQYIGYNNAMDQFNCDPECFQAGCMDPAATNYNPDAIIQPPEIPYYACQYPENYGFNCRPGHISGTGKCVAGTPQSPGQFDSMEECLKSGCEEAPTYANPFKDPNYGGPEHFDTRPIPADFDDRASIPLKESFKNRLQKLAGIKKLKK